MRLYNIASGILLILPLIDFALAAPVQVEENARASADVVDAPRHEINVLGKRVEVGAEEVEKVAALFESPDKSIGSSDAHVSSSSESATNPGPESSTSNPGHGSEETSSASSTLAKPLSFDQQIDQAWANHYYDSVKNGPNKAPTPALDSGSFDDRITSTWDTHYDVVSKEDSGLPHAPPPNPEPAASEPGSFDKNIDGLWAQRYADHLKNGPPEDNKF